MKNLLIAAGLLLTIAGFANAKSWNGITPLQTSRFEVIGILGSQTGIEDDQAVFETSGETVLISWIRNDCHGALRKVSESEAETWHLVDEITVKPKQKKRVEAFADLRIDPPRPNDVKPDLKETYQRWLSTDVSFIISAGPGRRHPKSAKVVVEGLSFERDSDFVTHIYYYPTLDEDTAFDATRPECTE